jgi:hypothetical protein
MNVRFGIMLFRIPENQQKRRYLLMQIVIHAALCSFTCRIVSSEPFFDHRIGSKVEQATASVPTEAVVVAQPLRINSRIGSSAARIALANEIARTGKATMVTYAWMG